MAQPKGTAKRPKDETPESETTPEPDSGPPVLDLSSVIKDAVPVEHEAYLTIDGERYPYARVSAFSLRERRKYTAHMERIMALEGMAEPSDEDEREYRGNLEAMASQLVPGVPSDTVQKFDDGQLADIALAFFAWAAEHHPRMAVVGRLGVMSDKLRRSGMLTGARSSPISSASTEETQSDG